MNLILPKKGVLWKEASSGTLHAPRSWVPFIASLVTVRKKFMRHSVPLALPESTLKRPRGTVNLLTHFSAALSRVVAALKPSAAGSEMKA